MLWEHAVIGWDVGNNVFTKRLTSVPFPSGSKAPFLPSRSFARRGNPRLSGLYYITESPVFTGLSGVSRLLLPYY